MTTITLTDNDDTFSAQYGETVVDAKAGTDTLIVDWSLADGPLRTWAYQLWGDGIRMGLTDDGTNTVDAYNFNIFRLTGGAESDDLRGWNNADILIGGGGDDVLSGGLGNDLIDGGAGTHDTWAVDYSSLGPTPIVVTLNALAAGFTVAATGTVLKRIEQVSLTTGTGDDIINTERFEGDDSINTNGGDDTVRSGRGIDNIWMQDGLDTIVMNWSAVTTGVAFNDLGGWHYQFSSGEGDQLNIHEAYRVEQYQLTGGSGDDYLRGLASDRGAFNDVLRGGAGNDQLYGYRGIDTIDGGDGVDLYAGDFTDLGTGVKIDIAGGTQVKALNDGSGGSLGTIARIERLNVSGSGGNGGYQHAHGGRRRGGAAGCLRRVRRRGGPPWRQRRQSGSPEPRLPAMPGGKSIPRRGKPARRPGTSCQCSELLCWPAAR